MPEDGTSANQHPPRALGDEDATYGSQPGVQPMEDNSLAKGEGVGSASGVTGAVADGVATEKMNSEPVSVATQLIAPQGWVLSIDELAKVLGLLIAGTYAGLFLSYQRFYSPLGLAPEDVGVTQLYVASRALALLPQSIVPVLAVIAALVMITANLLAPRIFGFIVVGSVAAAWATLAEVGVVMLVTRLLFFGAILLAGYLAWRRSRIVNASESGVATASRLPITLTLVIGVLLSQSYYTWNLAAKSVGEVLEGRPTIPARAIGLPFSVLDVRADPATIIWVGPIDQRPVAIFPDPGEMATQGLFLGQAGILYITVINGQTVRFPLASVTIESRPA